MADVINDAGLLQQDRRAMGGGVRGSGTKEWGVGNSFLAVNVFSHADCFTVFVI